MPHGSGIAPSGRIPPSGLARSSSIWAAPPDAFPLPTQPDVGHSSTLGYTHCAGPVGGAMSLLLPGGAAALDSDTLSFLNSLQSDAQQVKILSRAQAAMGATGYVLTDYRGFVNTVYAGSTGLTFPRIAGATACRMQGFTVQSGDIEQTESNAFATPGPHGYGNVPGVALSAGAVGDYGFPFAGLGSDPSVTPGLWSGSDAGTVLVNASDGPAYSLSFVSDTVVPLAGGFIGLRATSPIYAPFGANLVGTWSAQFALYFTWYTLVPWTGSGSPPSVGVDLHSVSASDRGGCC